ncbi:MAG: hypothetical protein NT049_12390 [Planctomycetota bacterium]|nr:hypothetical protein [Planctomycetota bacterium]
MASLVSRSIGMLAALTFTLAAPALAADAPALALPDWKAPADAPAIPFQLGGGAPAYAVWGGVEGGALRTYPDDLLPAVFERTLAVEKLDLAGGRIEWVFTGERGGFTVSVDAAQVTLAQRFYDSPAFNLQAEKPARHGEWHQPEVSKPFTGPLLAITVRTDHKLGLEVALNGETVLAQKCLLDVSRHQLRLSGKKAAAAGRVLSPPAVAATVRVDPAKKFQTMIGFGGIATPTAYAILSPEGKRLWWNLVARYNLLIQREYPIGTRLAPAMDNWDRLADATPHYYGDNFPNGEISDFRYIRTLRQLGGKVWFEFWALPPWVDKDVDKYAAAVVAYCRASKEKAGAPPNVVGIQNEVKQTDEQWHKMTLALRRELDKAGFKVVRIHISDDGSLAGGIGRAKAFRASAEAWAAIDYAASHMYDYQGHFTNPDAFDATLLGWKAAAGEKPFLSTELCINNSAYQWPTYRLALAMGQLYHKNLTVIDAAAICYCWTLINVEQPSYGWTRTLCVTDAARGFVPAATSHQLRVFGAFSRRIREGMVRVEARSSQADLLVSAFEGGGARTVVLLNRSASPLRASVAWPGGGYKEVEIADPYHENTVAAAPAPAADGSVEVAVPPGAFVTLTSAPLGKLPDGFASDGL